MTQKKNRQRPMQQSKQQPKQRQNAPTPSALGLRTIEGFGVLCAFFALYLIVSINTYTAGDPSFNVATPSAKVANTGGLIGAYASDLLIQFFGLAAYLFPLVFAYLAYRFFTHKQAHTFVRLLLLPFMLISATMLLQLWHVAPNWPTPSHIGNGGLIGKLMLTLSAPLLGKLGAGTLAFVLFSMTLMWWTGTTVHDVYHACKVTSTYTTHWTMICLRAVRRIKFKHSTQITLPLSIPRPNVKKTTAVIERPVVTSTISMPSARQESERQEALPLDLGEGGYQLPPIHLLRDNTDKSDNLTEEELQQNARQIETQLANFGVKGEVHKICPGPVITIYELEPAPGVKTATIVGLSNDLARAMSATAIRIAPIPGRNVIGIELPNRNRKMVAFKDMMASEQFETHPGKLAVSLGVDTAGNNVYADIAKMPHALIAGTTGSGKSVAMNAFIVSLLYRMTPEQLKFVMIDPKILELSIYNGIPHLLTPVITDPNKASAALKWLVAEMDARYHKMSDLGVKNMQSFNAKFEELQAKGAIPMKNVQTGFAPETGQPIFEQRPVAEEPMPYIVVVLDELADLMMVAGKEVEQSIARLAQKARASGIHLLVATQRPSVDVITGLIKANIPTRISFSVTSKIDSRTVLDSQGAEQLLGKGDMLFMENGTNALVRLHGSFLDEDECHAVVAHIKTQGTAKYKEDIFSSPAATGGAGGAGGEAIGDDDPLYRQAIEIVAREQKASTSFIQRHLKIGYNRAATIVEKMESDGLISAANHVGKREVVIKQPPETGY